MIDDVLKQHRQLEDMFGGGAAMREVMRQASSAQALYHQFGLSSSFARAFADAHLGSTTARDFIKQMEDSSAAARLAAGYDHGTSVAVRSLAAGYGASEVGRSLTQWQELVGSTALANAEVPRFTIEELPDRMLVTYHSSRRLCHFVAGLLAGLSDYYQVPMTVKQVSCILEGGRTCTFEVSFPGQGGTGKL